MRTQDFIATLAADGTQAMPPSRALMLGLAGALASAAILFFILLGPRPDFLQAMHTLRFDFKFAVTLALAASAFVLALRVSRPDANASRAILFAAPLMLAIAVAAELIAVPGSDWAQRLIGHNARVCMFFIPVLSLLPLAAFLAALRRGAVMRPMLAGAVAGLIAGGIGAAFYAAHCPDDSPLFVAVWYCIAIGFVSGLGAIAGSRVLRW